MEVTAVNVNTLNQRSESLELEYCTGWCLLFSTCTTHCFFFDVNLFNHCGIVPAKVYYRTDMYNGEGVWRLDLGMFEIQNSHNIVQEYV